MSAAGRDAGVLTPPASASLADDYFQFTINADAGNTLQFTTLGFDLAVVSNAASATTTAWAIQVYASVNGGAYTQVGATIDIASGSWESLTATSITGSGPYSPSVDISSLNATPDITTVTFRVWQGSDHNTDSTVALAYQNINVQGDVIPEPSAAAFLTLPLTLLRRRRRQSCPPLPR